MRSFFLASAFLFLASETSIAQISLPDHQWIGTGRVSAKINNKGALVTSFMVPNEEDDGSQQISTVGNISIWMGGIDPSGNLAIAIQRIGWAVSDFQGGFRGVPESGGVWKVTKEEIGQHIQDFEEDGDIDVEIPAIYSWPGRGNPFSQQWNGFALDATFEYMTAGFFDKNSNNLYEPHLGEYPQLANFYLFINANLIPDEITYIPFHNKEFSSIQQHPVGNQINCAAGFFSYDCDDATFLEDAVFGYVYFDHVSDSWRLDSFFFAFYINSDIGNADDDYLGTLPGNALTYFYNADSIDESGFEANPPIFGFDSHYGGLLDTFGNNTGLNSIMALHPAPAPVPPGTTTPMLPAEYYNYLTGSWRDGSPLQYGGDGYQSNDPLTSFIFPGNPGNPNEWSEVSANNSPGDRRALIAHGPIVLRPGARNRLLFALENVSGNNIAQQVEKLKQYSQTQELFFNVGFFPPAVSPFDSIPCLNTTATMQPNAATATLFPNPARTHLTLRTEELGLQQVVVFDMLGRAVITRRNIPADSQEITLPVAGISPGLYFLHWTMRDGRRGSGKVMIAN